MDTVGLQGSSAQDLRLKRGIRRTHRALRAKREGGSGGGGGDGGSTEKSVGQELAAESQEKRREGSKAERARAKQAVFEERRGGTPGGGSASVAAEEAEPFDPTPQPAIKTTTLGLQPAPASGSPFRPNFKPSAKKLLAAKPAAKPAAGARGADGSSSSDDDDDSGAAGGGSNALPRSSKRTPAGRGPGQGRAAGGSAPDGCAAPQSYHVVEVEVPQGPARPRPPASGAEPLIALNGQPMRAVRPRGAGSTRAASAAPAAAATPSATPSATSSRPAKPATTTPSRVLNPWESRMDAAVFAAFASGVDASDVGRALDACCGAHSSRALQVGRDKSCWGGREAGTSSPRTLRAACSSVQKD
jgi:hypothetical protein